MVDQSVISETQIDLLGDIPSFSERLVVSPSAGRFVPLPPKVFTAEGEWVEVGQVLAEIHLNGRKIPVRSSHRGWLMSTLSLPGAPVTAGEALFCVRES